MNNTQLLREPSASFDKLLFQAPSFPQNHPFLPLSDAHADLFERNFFHLEAIFPHSATKFPQKDGDGCQKE